MLSVLRNVFIIIVSIDFDDNEKKTDATNISFTQIQKYVNDTYDVKISKSSITQVRNKCGIDKLERHAKHVENVTLKSEKEKLVFETFKHFEIV